MDVGPFFSGWWFQPIWKIVVKMGIFPKVRGENKKIFETATYFIIFPWPQYGLPHFLFPASMTLKASCLVRMCLNGPQHGYQCHVVQMKTPISQLRDRNLKLFNSNFEESHVEVEQDTNLELWKGKPLMVKEVGFPLLTTVATGKLT